VCFIGLGAKLCRTGEPCAKRLLGNSVWLLGSGLAVARDDETPTAACQK